MRWIILFFISAPVLAGFPTMYHLEPVSNPAPTLITTGLKLHFESDSGVVTSGSTVTSWEDQSTNGYDLTATGDPQLVVASDLNNNQVIDFDGTGDLLLRNLNIADNLPDGNQDRTLFILVKYRGLGWGGIAYGNNNSNDAFGLVVSNTDGKLTVQGWGGANDFKSTADGTGAGWIINSVILDSGAITHYLNNVVIDTQTHTYTTALQEIVVAANLSQTTYIDMQVAAFLLYDRALTPAEHTAVYDYLNAKY